MSQASTLSGTSTAYKGFNLEFGSVLGKGSFGVVYEGQMTETKPPYRQCTIAMKTESTTRRRSSLIREAKLYEDLPESPYLCQSLACFRKSETRILVLQKMGPSLEAMSRTHGPLPAPCVALIAIDVLKGLEALHSAGLIHRDLKPANICLDMTGLRAKLIDFGLAGSYLDPDGSHPSDPVKTRFMGTVPYASRNALRDLRQSRRDDVESLVFVLLKLLRSNMPWTERFKRKLTAEQKSMHRQVILDVKSLYVPDTLFPAPQYPCAFAKFMRMVGYLKYNAAPRYRLCRRSFEHVGEDSMENRKRWFPWYAAHNAPAPMVDPPVVEVCTRPREEVSPSAPAKRRRRRGGRKMAATGVADDLDDAGAKSRRWIRMFQRQPPSEHSQILQELQEQERNELQQFLAQKAETEVLNSTETFIAVNSSEYRAVEKLFVMRKMSFSKAVFSEMNSRGFDELREMAERYTEWKADLQV